MEKSDKLPEQTDSGKDMIEKDSNQPRESLRLQVESLKFRKVGNQKQKYYNEAIEDVLELIKNQKL